jgi:hypothetical protein
MDDDLSQENRIRLIGRLFFFTCARRLILRSFAYVKVFSFMQSLGCYYRIPWAKSWTNGQIVDKSLSIYSSKVIIEYETKPK